MSYAATRKANMRETTWRPESCRCKFIWLENCSLYVFYLKNVYRPVIIVKVVACDGMFKLTDGRDV